MTRNSNAATYHHHKNVQEIINYVQASILISPTYIHITESPSLLVLVLGPFAGQGSDVLAPDEDRHTQQTESGSESCKDTECAVVSLGLNHGLDTIADSEAHDTSHGTNDNQKGASTRRIAVE